MEKLLNINNDRKLIDLKLVHSWITESYWAKGIPFEVFERSVENSLPFGVYLSGKCIGFARIVSDFATFAYLGDVFIVQEHRGQGYSKKLMEEIMNHPKLQGLRRICLGTWDAHDLYRQFGFEVIEEPKRWMEIRNKNPYNTENE